MRENICQGDIRKIHKSRQYMFNRGRKERSHGYAI